MTPRDQFDLIEYLKGPGARHADPDTSHAAADRFRSHKVYSDVMGLLEKYGPLTDFELAAHLRRQQTSIGKRRGELRDAGLIIDSGFRRPSPSGSMAIVWQLRDRI